jgi:hypothetical protein
VSELFVQAHFQLKVDRVRCTHGQRARTQVLLQLLQIQQSCCSLLGRNTPAFHVSLTFSTASVTVSGSFCAAADPAMTLGFISGGADSSCRSLWPVVWLRCTASRSVVTVIVVDQQSLAGSDGAQLLHDRNESDTYGVPLVMCSIQHNAKPGHARPEDDGLQEL